MLNTSEHQPVPGGYDRVQHPLVEQKVSHPLGHDEVEFLLRQLRLLQPTLHQGDPVTQLVLSQDVHSLEQEGAS